MSVTNYLLIFLKHPTPGMVKTRLAQEIGNERAAALYKIFVELIMSRTQSSEYKRIVYFSPPDKKNEITQWLGSTVTYAVQEGRDLGERMGGAFRFAFQQGAQKVVVIGTDSPFVDRNIILETFTVLNHNQCVIGPSEDGGYYLLGLNEFHEVLFKHIAWGTTTVFAQTLRRIKDNRITFALFEKRLDVDRWRDLKKLHTQLQNISTKEQQDFAPLKKMTDEICDTSL